MGPEGYEQDMTEKPSRQQTQTGERDSHRGRRGPAATAQLESTSFSALEAVGGARGLIESVLPSLVFLVVFTIWRNLVPTLIATASVCAVCLAARLLQRQSVRSVAIGFVLAVVCLLSAWLTRDARNYYVPGFLINGFWLIVLLLTCLAGVPAIGLAVEIARRPSGGWTAWRSAMRGDGGLYRAYRDSTWMWVGMFALRLVAEIPLWVAGNVSWLGTVRIVTGLPLFALVAWLSWVMVHPPLERRKAAQGEEEPGGNTGGDSVMGHNGKERKGTDEHA